ncbi:hypothetical protein PTKIN_Ptkin07bG0302600 [Pterospermum kingtungense]
METPSSTRTVTRSQTLAALNNSVPVSNAKNEESEKSVSRTRTKNGKLQEQERSALIDITNDSPIVGLAMETPTSGIGRQRSSKAKNMMMMMTPGSGEALLRGQVKTLLQKVEEEAELSKLETQRPFFHHLQGCFNSPMGLLAPTPANTPQVVSNLFEDGGLNNGGLGSMVMDLPVVEQVQLKSCEEVVGVETLKSVITRSLLLDFSEKSDSSECYSSVVTGEGVITGGDQSSACKEKPSQDDDNASTWSIQVNASAHDDEDDEETMEEMGDDDYYNYNEDDEVVEDEEYDDDDDDGGWVDKISMEERFRGKHTRFVYHSDDEIEGEEEEERGGSEGDDSDSYSYSAGGGVIRLKGLPTPKGKHLRFPVEEQDE